jgi:DNA-binding NarL/FixJ family response regulator
MMKTILADLVLLDLEMPVLSGMEALKILRLRFPETKIIILSLHKEIAYVKNAMAHGANGYLSKDCLPEQLIMAISTVHEKGFYVEDLLLKDLVAESLYGVEQTLAKRLLSNREKEVLQALCDGKSEKEIALKLNISRHTVHFHRMNLHAKTKSHNLADLLRYATSNGLS